MGTPNLTSIERLFEIIEVLKSGHGATGTEISEKLDMPTSTIHSHLNTLHEEGYLDKNEQGEYYLGYSFLEIGGSVRQSRTIFEQVRPILMDLAKETGEAISYIIEQNGYGFLVANRRGENALLRNIDIGYNKPIYDSIQGRMILSYYSESRRNELFETFEFPVMDGVRREELAERIADIENEEMIRSVTSDKENVTAISAPVANEAGEFFGIVVVTGPTPRIDQSRQDEYADMLKCKVSGLNANLNYRI